MSRTGDDAVPERLEGGVHVTRAVDGFRTSR